MQGRPTEADLQAEHNTYRSVRRTVGRKDQFINMWFLLPAQHQVTDRQS